MYTQCAVIYTEKKEDYLLTFSFRHLLCLHQSPLMVLSQMQYQSQPRHVTTPNLFGPVLQLAAQKQTGNIFRLQMYYLL